MFKQNEERDIKSAETIIGESVKVKGDFYAQGNIVVDGTLNGSVKTAGDLFVGQKANIVAEVEAKSARIEGVVAGNIKVKDLLEIGASAKINGDVQAGSLTVAKGAVLNGQYTMGEAQVKEKEEIKKDKVK